MIEFQKKQIKRMKIAANIGLYGSVAFMIAIGAWSYFGVWQLEGLPQAMSRTMLIGGTVIAVLAAMVALLTIRRFTPKIRQLEDVSEKLRLYANNTCNLYYMVLAVVAAECALVFVSGNNILIMVTILLVVLLFLAYPNMYKLKVDLGLDDDTMASLFGDRYVRDSRSNSGSAIDQLKLDSQIEEEAKAMDADSKETSSDNKDNQ